MPYDRKTVKNKLANLRGIVFNNEITKQKHLPTEEEEKYFQKRNRELTRELSKNEVLEPEFVLTDKEAYKIKFAKKKLKKKRRRVKNFPKDKRHHINTANKMIDDLAKNIEWNRSMADKLKDHEFKMGFKEELRREIEASRREIYVYIQDNIHHPVNLKKLNNKLCRI